MAVREILRLGHPILRERARALTRAEILSAEIQELIEDMRETMQAANGLGLAAPQVGASLRIALVEIPENPVRYPDAQPFTLGIYINPQVKILDAGEQGYWEGCLSVPGLRGYVLRPRKLELKYFDREARPQTLIAHGFPATVFQHEFDHLDGKLFVDRVRDTRQLAFLEEFVEFHDPHRGAHAAAEE